MKYSELRTIFRERQRVGDTLGALSLLRTCCEIADAQFDLEAGFRLHHELMNCAISTMRVDILLEAFNWTLYQFDCDPVRFADWNPLRQYRWVLGRACNYPKLTRQRYDEMFDDMIRRYQAVGASLRSIYSNRRGAAQDFGDLEMARAAHREVQRHPPVEHMAPEAEHAHEIEYLLFIQEETQAIRLAERFLTDPDYGDVHKSEIQMQLLLPLARAGRLEEARALQRETVGLMEPERVYFWPYGCQLKFLALTDRLADACRIFPPLQRAAFRNTDPLTQLHFAMDALPLLERLRSQGIEAPELVIRIPECGEADRPISGIRELQESHFQHALRLAEAFDRRNGNEYYSNAVRAAPKAQLGSPLRT